MASPQKPGMSIWNGDCRRGLDGAYVNISKEAAGTKSSSVASGRFSTPGMSNWKGGSRCSFDGACVSTNRGASGMP